MEAGLFFISEIAGHATGLRTQKYGFQSKALA
jgi:hypothetical protein